MTLIPTETPLKAEDLATLAGTILDQAAEGRSLDQELRTRMAGQLDSMKLSSLRPLAPSLQKDPRNASTYYIAVDALAGKKPASLLLGIRPASSSSSDLFSGGSEVGRIRRADASEFVIEAFPFAPADRENVRNFAKKLEPAFLPRPQGAMPAIATGNRHPEISLPAVFEAFREVLHETGINLASTVQLSATREMTTDTVIDARDGENPTAAGHTRVSIRHLYHAGLWAAIRAGWREGYNTEADHFIVSGNTPEEIARSTEATKEAIHHAAGFTKFTTDTSRMFELQADARHPHAWSASVVADKFRSLFNPEEQKWIRDQFSQPFVIGDSTFEFSEEEILRNAVKFGLSIKLNEELYDFIKKEKAAFGTGEAFDFEPSLDEAETLTTAKEMIFYMQWLKSRGRPAQLVPPNLGFKKRQAYPVAIRSSESDGVGLEDYAKKKMWPELLPRVQKEFGGNTLQELGARVAELAAVARHFNGTLSIHSGSGKQPEVLQQIGKATGGRVNYKISGELQLQLLDVLSEQPKGTYWRDLYDRMAERCNRFAAQGAFADESPLAQKYLDSGHGFYLGDASRGRVDGNLFLVFWIGNMVGSRDIDAPDGDRRFFKEKLDELPANLLAEVRKRNRQYVVWLAKHLRP